MFLESKFSFSSEESPKRRGAFFYRKRFWNSGRRLPRLLPRGAFLYVGLSSEEHCKEIDRRDTYSE